ncbi:MAG: DNA primase [Patescibacteria group bacterium]|nr:DNA primase [Patescibacteria group bacterium]MDE2014953.1 DNA primase [Patescibacteria group bacterium]MDE2226382.1 DNA primase [Patescibacteria group bacterium]
MPSSTTETIKEKLDIVDFLRGYLNLQPAGKNFKAICPFHKEKTPSFMISPDRQSWHCFGCGLGGDVFGFVMRYENLEFSEALRVLAEKAGVELRRLDPAEHKYTGLLYELNNAAKEFFKKSLTASEPAKKYLAERGLKKETIEEFELGWAPNAAEALTMQLLNSRYAPEDVVRAGLALKTERGLLLDRFRGRIMFPIHNHVGKVVGFTGRVLPQFESADFGKYVNSPESPVFQKSRLLYGLDKSKNFIREAGNVFLVEGQMDLLMSWQAGVKNVVATSGTALTLDHLHSLRRLADEIILSFDSDSAGSAASERVIDLAEANDFGVKVVTFSDFKDPAEAAQAGAEKLMNAINKAVPAPEFYFGKYLPAKTEVSSGSVNYSDRGTLNNIRFVLTKLNSITSPIERAFWMKELSKRSGIEDRILLEESEKVGLPKTDFSKDASEAAEKSLIGQHKYSRRELIGEGLLRAAVAKNDFSLVEDCAPYFADVHGKIFKILKTGSRKSEDPVLDELIDFIILGSENPGDKEVTKLKNELIKEHYKDKKLFLARAVQSAEKEGNEARLRSALEELNNIPLQVFES